MKTINFFSIVSIFLLITFSSCNKSEVEPEKTKENNTILSKESLMLKYYNFIQQNTNGSISISGYSTLPTQNLASRYQSVKSFFKDQNYSDIALNDVVLVKNNDNIYTNDDNQKVKDLYGKDVNFSFKTPSGEQVSKSLYIPQLLYANVNYDPATFKVLLEENTEIRWNKDDKNTNGVVLILDYDPDLSPTQETHPKRITKVLGSADNGKYLISANDLSEFPKNGRLMLSLGRAGFNIYQPNNSSNTFSLYGVSLVDIGCIVN